MADITWKTRAVDGPLTSADIDANFNAFGNGINELKALVEAGGAAFTASQDIDGNLVLTRGDGIEYGPFPLPALNGRRLTWVTGLDLLVGDVVRYVGADGAPGSYAVLIPHLAGDFSDDLGAGKLTVDTLDGVLAYVDLLRATRLGAISTDALLDIIHFPVASNLSAAVGMEIACSLLTACGGTDTFDVVFKKLTAAGVLTTIGTATFVGVQISDTVSIAASFAVGDRLLVYTENTATAGSAADLSVAIQAVRT